MKGKRRVPPKDWRKYMLERPGDASRLTPFEYQVAIWIGRGGMPREIADRLDVPIDKVKAAITRIKRYKGCKSMKEIEALFVPDWMRIDGEDE